MNDSGSQRPTDSGDAESHAGGTDSRADENPYAAPVVATIVERMPAKLSVPLGLLLLAIIVAAFFFDVGLGVGCLLLAVPAYARAVGNTVRKARSGVEASLTDRLLSFLASVGVVIVCGIAGGIAFFGTCTASLMVAVPMQGGWDGDGFFMLLILLSCLGFFGCAGFVYWTLWPRRKTR